MKFADGPTMQRQKEGDVHTRTYAISGYRCRNTRETSQDGGISPSARLKIGNLT